MIGVIDIGSNSVRLMLWADGKTLFKRILTTRLAKDMQNRQLAGPSMARSAEAVSFFYGEAINAGAERVLAFATAAVRMAENGGEFCRLVKELCPLEVDVLSGEVEAGLASLGALDGGDGTVIDVGGASSEVFVRENGSACYAKSFPLGAVTLFERAGDDFEKCQKIVKETFASLPALHGNAVYSVGGTATSLACILLGLQEYSAEKVQNFYLSLCDLESLRDRLFSLTAEERKSIKGLDASRADIIAGGACILEEIVRHAKCGGMRVSDRDNLEGYLYKRGII